MRNLNRKSESGAILIVVLGILALLTVMAVSFVFSSRMTMRASEAYMSTVTANDIAEVGMASAVRVLEADKIKRTGDPRLADPEEAIIETYDSLRDDWRKDFSAPVIVAYSGTDTGAVPGDVVVNMTDNDNPTAKIIAIDRSNNLLYLNSASTALWSANDNLRPERDQTSTTFNVTISSAAGSVSKPDEVDLDGDDVEDAVWHNYYDESGALLGRYAVLIQDESSKINVNVAAGLQDNEGWSVHEISIANGLNASSQAQQIYSYRFGLPAGIPPPPVGNTEYRINLPGQGDGSTTPGTASTFDDDDDNFNRYFYANDGVDNDGDGLIDDDDTNEGLNEPEEFRVLRPFRTGSLDYDLSDNDGDGLTDETNEGDDQPILTLEQLEDSQGVDLTGFLTTGVSTNFAGETDTSRERRHFISTLSWDRNLSKDGKLRTNLNFLDSIEASVAIYDAVYSDIPSEDLFSRTNFQNLQIASNIYDYRDRDNIPVRIYDTAGDAFAGVESIRINEVMVRAATSLYEAEHLDFAINNWVVGSSPVGEGAGSPRGDENYLRHSGDNAAEEFSADSEDIILPDPPYSSDGGPDGDGLFPFKLRMRVRSDGTHDHNDHRGFEVYLNGTLVNPTSGINSVHGQSTNGRWATFNTGTGTENWYIEEAIVVLETGNNYIYFRKRPATLGTVQDTVDIDWFYFTQEPDCEWIELVNIGKETVNVNNWTVVSEYIKDEDETALAQYYRETYQLTLPGVGILPVDNQALWSPGPPHYVVFVVDRDISDSVDSTATIDSTADEEISFDTTWTTLANSANIYQFTSITNIYTGWIDFFGNEPFNDPNDDTGPIGSRNSWYNIDVGQISLYDADGNLVDRVTYDYGDVRAGFRSLQRNHPANPGDRLDSSENFKMQSFWATDIDPESDYNVPADGAYDNWKFPWDDDPSASDRHELWWSTPATANNRSATQSERVATRDGSVKNRFFANVGELGSVPFYNEYLAFVGYNEGGANDDLTLLIGDAIINTSPTPTQRAILLSIDTGNDWMVLRGDRSNPVNTWASGDIIANIGATFLAGVTSVKALDTIEMDGLQFFAKLDYPSAADDTTDLDAGDTITNSTLSETATLIYVDIDEDYLIVQGDATNPVHDWAIDDLIDNSGFGGSFSTSMLSNYEIRRDANVRMLADYFTTSMIDLEAALGTPSGSGYTLDNWPDTPSDDNPEVPLVSATGNFDITWDEDDGVEDGTYNLYSVVNFGDGAADDVAISLGPETITGGTLTLDITNTAAEQYHFMRAILSPPPQTFGRINVNTASHRVLQGLPGIDAALATNIINARNAQAIYSIGDLYRVSETDADFTPAVFGSISNLITTRSDVYKIIVLGQAALDSNGNGIIEDEEITSEKKVELIYQR